MKKTRYNLGAVESLEEIMAKKVKKEPPPSQRRFKIPKWAYPLAGGLLVVVVLGGWFLFSGPNEGRVRERLRRNLQATGTGWEAVDVKRMKGGWTAQATVTEGGKPLHFFYTTFINRAPSQGGVNVSADSEGRTPIALYNFKGSPPKLSCDQAPPGNLERLEALATELHREFVRAW
jgi:hypothetical protein